MGQIIIEGVLPTANVLHCVKIVQHIFQLGLKEAKEHVDEKKLIEVSIPEIFIPFILSELREKGLIVKVRRETITITDN